MHEGLLTYLDRYKGIDWSATYQLLDKIYSFNQQQNTDEHHSADVEEVDISDYTLASMNSVIHDTSFYLKQKITLRCSTSFVLPKSTILPGTYQIGLINAVNPDSHIYLDSDTINLDAVDFPTNTWMYISGVLTEVENLGNHINVKLDQVVEISTNRPE